MESSFNGVELRELRGEGGRRGASPTTGSAACTVVTLGRAARGFENASYQQDDDQIHHYQRQQGVTASVQLSTSGNNKVN